MCKYNAEKVEHLVQQLCELRRQYDYANGICARIETEKAMKTINAALKEELETKE